MTHGLPNGVRQDEISYFVQRHPAGVYARFKRVEENAWKVIQVFVDKDTPYVGREIGSSVVSDYVDNLIDEVERDGDAVVLNADSWQDEVRP